MNLTINRRASLTAVAITTMTLAACAEPDTTANCRDEFNHAGMGRDHVCDFREKKRDGNLTIEKTTYLDGSAAVITRDYGGSPIRIELYNPDGRRADSYNPGSTYAELEQQHWEAFVFRSAGEDAKKAWEEGIATLRRIDPNRSFADEWKRQMDRLWREMIEDE